MRGISLASFVLATIASMQPAGASAPFWTAGDPFVGKWRLDVSRSTIVDDMNVEALGHNRFAFSFEGAPTETIVADGTDQPGLPGTTLAVESESARSLTIVRKQDGHIVLSASWKLSPSGRTLRDSFTSVQPDGSEIHVDYVYRRVSGSSGFAGDWESTTKPIGLKLEITIKPFEDKGLSFASPGSLRNVIFDGRQHAATGADTNTTFLGRRRGARLIEYAENDHGKLLRARSFRLSSDGRTLTETIHVASHLTPDVLVFERE
jgi:hypothetical protein